MLDSLGRDIRYAYRTLLRAPLAALTIVATVGLGLGLVAAVYTIVNAMVFRVDEVRNPHELFGIERPSGTPDRFTRDQYEALLRDTDTFVDAFATTADVQAWIEGVRREGRLVTGNFFSMLGVSAWRGRVLTSADDQPGSPPVIVLSHRAWVQHYGSDPGVIGRTYRVNGTAFEVIGITPERFRGLEVIAAPDFWVPLSTIDLVPNLGEGGQASHDVNVVGRLGPGVSTGQALARLAAWDAQRAAEERSADGDRARPSLALASRAGTVPRPAEAMLVFMPLFFAFGLILLIGCANVANLLLARLVARQREIGIRLAIGASRRRVVWQLLTESLLLALIAAALAFGISRVVLNGIMYAITASFPPDIGNLRMEVPAADWRVVVFLVFAAMASTVLFALGPALRATRLQVARVIHGGLLGGGPPGRARDALVALQVTGSALLLICAALFLRGAWAAATRDPGVRTADVVNVSVLNEEKRAAIVETLRGDPSVATVAAAWPGVLGGVPAYGAGASGKQVVRYQFVSPEFFGVLDIDVVRGRGFTDTERNPNEAVALVSETAARELWPGSEAIGQTLRVEPDPTIGRPADAPPLAPEVTDDPMLQARTAVVIGVTRDVAGFQIGGITLGGPGVYMPVDARAPSTVLVTRVRGDAGVARRGLVDRLAAIDPNMAETSLLETMVSTNAYILGSSFWATLVLGSLALLLTVSGLFSVLSYLVEQRTREIGVRMALGASKGSIGGLVLKQSATPVGLGVLIGSGLTFGLSATLLATPAAEQIGSIVQLFDPVAYGASLLCIVAACAAAALAPALRAGRVNPLVALRQD